jgi:hypothetical protein
MIIEAAFITSNRSAILSADGRNSMCVGWQLELLVDVLAGAEVPFIGYLKYIETSEAV